MTYMEHPIFPWTQDHHLRYSETDIAAKVRLLQYARQLVTSNSEAKAASKRSYDIKTRLRKFKAGDQVPLYLPNPPPGTNRKFYSPWRGIYTVIERTSDLTYKVRKKGGRIRVTHINRLKFYDPENSGHDATVHLSNNEDLGTPEQPQTEDSNLKEATPPHQDLREERTTRSKSKKLPPPIQRFTAATNVHYNTVQAPATLSTYGPNTQKYNAQISNDTRFAEDFRYLFQSSH